MTILFVLLMTVLSLSTPTVATASFIFVDDHNACNASKHECGYCKPKEAGQGAHCACPTAHVSDRRANVADELRPSIGTRNASGSTQKVTIQSARIVTDA